MTQIAEWIDGRFGLKPVAPHVAGGFASTMPAKDADLDHEAHEETSDEGDLQGQCFVIEYHDSAGEISKRRITVRKLVRTIDGALCLKAHCWEREAPRAFRVDRILCCWRLRDPRPILNLNAFFEGYMHDGFDTATALLMKRVRPGLRVLLYLARCDGNVHPSEVNVMRTYVAGLASSAAVNWAFIDDFLDSQHPDRHLARSMLKAALNERAGAGRLLTSAKILIDADGIVAPEEVDVLEKMLTFSEGLRYQEDIRFK